MSANSSNDDKNKNDLLNMIQANVKDIIAYVLIVIGIILTLVDSFWGGFLVGVVLGYFYKDKIIDLATNFQKIIDQEGLVKSIVLGGALLTLLIGSFSFFIGTAVIVALYYVIGKDVIKKS